MKNLVCLREKKELEGTIKKMAAKKSVHKSKKIEEVGRQDREKGRERNANWDYIGVLMMTFSAVLKKF